MTPVREALRQVLAGHEPYPAVVVDRHWDLVDANRSVGLFMDQIPAELLTPPINVLRVSLHPRGMASRIVNLGDWRVHILDRLRRQISRTGDAELETLYAELRGYPGDPPGASEDPRSAALHGAGALPGPNAVVAPLRVRHGERELAFFTIVASFGTPVDITVAELAIESFYPADPFTAGVLRSQMGS
jgi:hypothetical protein